MEYLLKSTFILSLFYGFYKLLLQKDTYFQSIRFYFIAGMISALLLPLIIIKKYIFVEPILNTGIVNLNENQIQTIQEPTLTLNSILFTIYMVGLLLFSVKFLIQFSSLLWFLYNHPKTKKGKFTFIDSKKDIAPFSFFNYIIFNKDSFKKDELDQILAHEKIHASQFHSIDNILIQVLAIFNWFNPLVWFYTREVQKNLEFIADNHAKEISAINQNYQHLLLKTVSPHYHMALTSNFYNSLIKKRIDMLQKNRSKKLMQIKFLLIIPMLIVFVFTFNTKVIAQKKITKTITWVESDFVEEIITKDFSKTDLEKLKTRLSSQGISFKFKKLKYNSNNEIIGISISVKDKNGNQSNFSQKSEHPIKTILININLVGTLSVGNTPDIPNHKNVYFSSGSNGEHKTIIVKNGKNGNKNTVWVSDDNDATTLSMGNVKTDSYTYKIKRIGGDDDIIVGHDGNSDPNKKIIFISDGKIEGDSTKLKEIEIIEMDEDGSHKVIMKSNKETKENTFIIKTDDDKINASNNKGFYYRSDTNKTPLIILDGKEIKDKKIDDISPDTIESINVFKGEKAIEKYGDKGKDGVIEITTKK